MQPLFIPSFSLHPCVPVRFPEGFHFALSLPASAARPALSAHYVQSEFRAVRSWAPKPAPPVFEVSALCALPGLAAVRSFGQFVIAELDPSVAGVRAAASVPEVVAAPPS